MSREPDRLLMRLEIQTVPSGTPKGASPLLFVHGAFLSAWCWAEHFLPWFAARGHASYAVSLRGHGDSEGRDNLHDHGMADFAEDVNRAADRVVEETGREPVLIGHSMGGMVVGRVLATRAAPAAVLMAPVPPYGLAWPSLELAWRNPFLFHQVSLIHGGGGGGGHFADPETTRQVLFSRDMPKDQSLAHHLRMEDESGRARLDMMGFDLPFPTRGGDVPLLVQGAAQDVFFPPHMIHATAAMLGAEVEMIPRMAHAMMLDVRWKSSAERLGVWLARHGLAERV